MSANYTYFQNREEMPFDVRDSNGENGANPEIDQKLGKVLKRLVFFVFVGMVMAGVWFFVVSPCKPLVITVKGFPGFDGGDVLAFAGIGRGASYLSLSDTSAVEEKLAEHYLVGSARVIKRFPDRLSIFLEPRRAVAVSLSVSGGRQMPVYFDRQGVVFKIGNSKGEVPSAILPVLSGLVIDQPSLGMKLLANFSPLSQAMFESLFADLEKIEDEAPALMKGFSEIKVVRRGEKINYMVLYPVNSPIRVKLGEHIDADTLRYALLILDVFKSANPMPEEIDFRAGMGVYTIKEAYSGER